MGNERYKTKEPGIFYRIRKRVGGAGTEKVYYAVFKRDGKTVETLVGRQYRDNMTVAKAKLKRGELIEGRQKTAAEKRAEVKIKVWTFDALWQEYRSQRGESRTLKPDDCRYRLHIQPSLGRKEPGKIVPLDIDRLRINLLKKRSPQTVKHVVGLVKRISSFGHNKGLCAGLNFRPQMPPVDNLRTEDLTPTELRRLIEAIDADENRTVAAMMRLALVSGMRRGELCRLKWTDIDRSRGFINIAQSKGGKAMSIPLNDAAADTLDRLPRTSEYVFPADGGGQRLWADKASKRIRDRAGLPKTFRPFHGLRHVFASQLASSGKVDLYVLQRLLTHKSPVMTQRYAHLRDSTLKAASDIAGDILTEAGKETEPEKKTDIKILGRQ